MHIRTASRVPTCFEAKIRKIDISYHCKPQYLVRLYESTGRAIAVTPALALVLVLASALLKMLKFLIKVFMCLYLLKLWMDQYDTLHVDIGLKFYAVPS